jgi:hypothetical protein
MSVNLLAGRGKRFRLRFGSIRLDDPAFESEQATEPAHPVEDPIAGE